MKRIDRLILRSFIGPLVLTFVLAVFVLLMQFVWKYIDDMVGKGLDFKVIVELLLYASATFVPMALPIAVLFASIMTMGNFGEKYELVAMKAGGISVRRAMMPMAIFRRRPVIDHDSSPQYQKRGSVQRVSLHPRYCLAKPKTALRQNSL